MITLLLCGHLTNTVTIGPKVCGSPTLPNDVVQVFPVRSTVNNTAYNDLVVTVWRRLTA